MFCNKLVPQVLHEREEHIQQLRVECETMSQNHRETFIEASDMDGEVNKLKKVGKENLINFDCYYARVSC